jgi:hypothetical protein
MRSRYQAKIIALLNRNPYGSIAVIQELNLRRGLFPAFCFALRNPDIFLFNKKNCQNQREPPRPREDLL